MFENQFASLLLFCLIGTIIGITLGLLIDYLITKIKSKREKLTVGDLIVFNSNHPEIIKFKKFMLDDFGFDEWLVENELDRIKTIKDLKLINLNIEKGLKKNKKIN